MLGLLLKVGAVFLLAPLFYFTQAPTSHLTVHQERPPVLTSRPPVRLTIPSIAIDSAVEQVGVTVDGAMEVPKGPDTVGWYERGPRPGEIGSAVMAGHYGWKNNEAAVFDNLYTLQVGDKLYVEDDQGVTTSFVVRDRRHYDPAADASDVFTSRDGIAHLNLITCGGVWNHATQSYSERLIVFADKE